MAPLAPLLPYIMMGASIASTGLSALGQYRQGQAAQAGYEYNAKVAQANAVAARQKAKYDEDISRAKLNRLMGTQRALYAKAGVDITSGSPLLVLADTAAEGEKEALAIRYGGNVEAIKQENEARLQKLYGKSAYSSGLWGAGSTFLSGLGSTGMTYYQGKSQGWW